ncbi:hypothetical protein GJAV_G00157670 [Gymnothorax javanicus]|nr:hypothetical protein GJAV_G00157670 [Gymnothorax javanicus]
MFSNEEPTFEEEEGEKMDIYEEDMRWFFLAECGDWHKFGVTELLDYRKIEEHYSRNWNGFMDYCIGDCIYRLDFSAMKQINFTTKQERPIKRAPCSRADQRLVRTTPLSIPSYWETDLPFQLISLESDTRECQDVVKSFTKTMPNTPIKSIRRIQNITLWKAFCCKRDQLTQAKKMPLEERMLFHGTPQKNIRDICMHNFDLKYAGTHGSVYGRGIYFAKHASYSKKYCSTDESRNGISPPLTMILARVLVGEYTLGEARFREAPPKDRTKTSFYDSCVDNFFHPSTFVVFDRNQVYPEYLIEL